MNYRDRLIAFDDVRFHPDDLPEVVTEAEAIEYLAEWCSPSFRPEYKVDVTRVKKLLHRAVVKDFPEVYERLRVRIGLVPA